MNGIGPAWVPAARYPDEPKVENAAARPRRVAEARVERATPRRSDRTRAEARARTSEIERQARARIESPQYAHDVRMSEADRARLPRDQAEAVRQARTTYAGLLNRGYHVAVTQSAGNGNRPVIVIQPPGLDPNQPINVHTHYHGNGGSAFGNSSPATRRTDAIREITQRDPQTVFVLPTAGAGDNGRQWRNVNQAQTSRDAIAGLSQTMRARDPATPDLTIGMRTASFHSAGHGALTSSANQRGGLDVDRVEMLDSVTTAATNALVRWKQGEGRNAHVSIHEGAASGLQEANRAGIARNRELVGMLRGVGAVLASTGEDHYALVYRHLQGNVSR